MIHADRRLTGFLLLSALLHLAWLSLPLPTRTSRTAFPESIVAHLPPLRQPEIASVSPLSGRDSALARRHASPTRPFATALPAPEDRLPSVSAAPIAPAIDLGAARAAARKYAREAPPDRMLDTPKPQLTVEAAIARATEPDSVVETRGPNGEHIVQTRDLRCVTPLVVPHYMEGMTVPSQCAKRRN